MCCSGWLRFHKTLLQAHAKLDQMSVEMGMGMGMAAVEENGR